MTRMSARTTVRVKGQRLFGRSKAATPYVWTPADVHRRRQERLKHMDPISLWFEYLPVYHEITKNPEACRAMRNDPGMKFMRAGLRIALGAFVLLWFFTNYSNALGV